MARSCSVEVSMEVCIRDPSRHAQLRHKTATAMMAGNVFIRRSSGNPPFQIADYRLQIENRPKRSSNLKSEIINLLRLSSAGPAVRPDPSGPEAATAPGLVHRLPVKQDRLPPQAGVGRAH